MLSVSHFDEHCAPIARLHLADKMRGGVGVRGVWVLRPTSVTTKIARGGGGRRRHKGEEGGPRSVIPGEGSMVPKMEGGNFDLGSSGGMRARDWAERGSTPI
ncbi:hypothetical protein TIFTF001_009233 [Ficus carica]|uniref:Uncharacterized protein n=1 Tax=Ficus carica TaxID=3494 RepID=A0AA87ZW59_FICCA|nr:hypothetical protein TIFTF001_009233 [Ficus carica]